jgi:hypothetical protein
LRHQSPPGVIHEGRNRDLHTDAGECADGRAEDDRRRIAEAVRREDTARLRAACLVTAGSLLVAQFHKLN